MIADQVVCTGTNLSRGWGGRQPVPQLCAFQRLKAFLYCAEDNRFIIKLNGKLSGNSNYFKLKQTVSEAESTLAHTPVMQTIRLFGNADDNIRYGY